MSRSRINPHAFRWAVASAQFGGHFEIARAGIVPYVVEADLASAYPYETFFLPCLACGRWRRVTRGRDLARAIDESDLALCRVTWSHPKNTLWGALPYREADGSTIWPLACSGGSWAWKPEYLASLEVGGVRAHEAYVYRTDCDHRPFREIGALYAERVELGKEGRGKVLKLGLNAAYGSLVQAVGSKKYRAVIWGSNVTSGTRAELVRAMQTIGPEHVVMVATDAIYADVPIPPLRRPRMTGTFGLRDARGNPAPALGAWEPHTFEQGMFLARPGIYFDLGRGKLRSRGFSAASLKRAIPTILRNWERFGPAREIVVSETRFMGVKRGVRYVPDGRRERATADDNFADWYEHTMHISYDPAPKRAHMTPDHRLVPWPHPWSKDAPTTPYSKALGEASPEGARLRAARELAEDQDDGT